MDTTVTDMSDSRKVELARHCDLGGDETVFHEYSLESRVEGDRAALADPRALRVPGGSISGGDGS